jgi:hypothetical protein
VVLAPDLGHERVTLRENRAALRAIVVRELGARDVVRGAHSVCIKKIGLLPIQFFISSLITVCRTKSRNDTRIVSEQLTRGGLLENLHTHLALPRDELQKVVMVLRNRTANGPKYLCDILTAHEGPELLGISNSRWGYIGLRLGLSLFLRGISVTLTTLLSAPSYRLHELIHGRTVALALL